MRSNFQISACKHVLVRNNEQIHYETGVRRGATVVEETTVQIFQCSRYYDVCLVAVDARI
jgi:hypothetical protein